MQITDEEKRVSSLISEFDDLNEKCHGDYRLHIKRRLEIARELKKYLDNCPEYANHYDQYNLVQSAALHADCLKYPEEYFPDTDICSK